MTQEPRADQHLAPILRAAARGDGSAWKELVGLYSRRVYALAKSRCRNRTVAEEITQSVFATLATKLGGGEYREQGRFEAWLFRMAMNRIRDHVRREARRPESVPVGEHDSLSGPEPESNQADLEQLRRAMASLPDADREIVELRHHGEMSFKDMSELLDEPMGTLLARHHRALKKLKELMTASSLTPSNDREVRT